jgi:hypothetical protein
VNRSESDKLEVTDLIRVLKMRLGHALPVDVVSEVRRSSLDQTRMSEC